MSFSRLQSLCSPIWNLYSVRSLLYWDQQVMMPTGSLSARSAQLAALETVSHQLLTHSELLAALEAAEEEQLEGSDAAYVSQVRRHYDLAAKLPTRLVEERSQATSQAVAAWAQARRDNRFGDFLPHLERVFRLTREVAEARGYQGHPYDALIDEYEPGFTTAQVEKLFAGLLPRLVALVGQIAQARPVSRKILQQKFPTQTQKQLSRYLLEQIGFSFEHGRLDQAVHPFCSANASVDVRLTDRLDEDWLPMSIFGSLHEGGHGLYEQGSPVEWMGTPLAGGCSLGIHESQSRLWENFVGRSLPFWEKHFPRLRELFPQQLWGYTAQDFYAAVNYVEPSFIRVEADEVTYTLHVVLRFELERDMLSGQLSPPDLPEAWRAKMKEYLGIEPPDDRLGCLQDIHWSDGLIGYFPTYSLGNLVAAQMWRKIGEEIASPEQDSLALLAWLREKVHRKASSLTPAQVIRQSCGEDLDFHPFLEYLEAKFRPLYQL